MQARTPTTAAYRGLGLLLVLLGNVGCGREGEAVSVRRDSAGVLVVEHAATATATGHWRLAEQPELDLGLADGPPEYSFVDVAAVVRRADGHLLVADAGAAAIREYDATGHILISTGRTGAGPGEYRAINSMGLGPADSVWVYDFALRRFTILTPDLAVQRIVPLGPGLSAVGAVGMLRGGGFVVREYFSAPSPARLAAGLRRDRVAVVRLDRDGEIRDTITTLLGREIAITEEDGRAVMNSPLVAHDAAIAFAGDRVIVGDQQQYELRVLDLDGRLRRIIRRDVGDLALDRTVVPTLRSARIDAAPAGDQARLARQLDGLPVPATRPAYGEILAATDGSLWVAEWHLHGRGGGQLDRLRFRRRPHRSLVMPAGFQPTWIDADRVTGIQTDADGIIRILVYRIVSDSLDQQ